MPLFDYICPACNRVEPDVRLRPAFAVQVDCLACRVPMVRQLGIPAPAIFTSGGTGASRGAR